MVETQPTLPEEPKRPEPTMHDMGTRYQHLLDYKDSMEICLEITKKRGNGQAAAKFATALEVINTTLDAYSGYRETSTEFTLYRLLNSVPKSKDALREIGGIPLETNRKD